LGHGCTVVATSGKQLAMSCVRAGLTDPNWQPQWLRSLTTYDPKTQIETDHLCIERKLDAGTCFPELLSLNKSGITITIGLEKCARPAPWHLAFGSTKLKNLADADSNIGYLRGDGNIVVWMEGKKEWKHYQVVAYDLDTGKRWRVDPSNHDQWLPQVAGNKIVWVDHRNDPSGYRLNPKNSDIYMHDIATGKTTAVTTHPARQEEPDVHGDWVIWQDYRDAPDGVSGKEIDIWAKNVATGKTYQVTDYPYLEIYPRVDSGRFFYRRTVNASNGLHMVDIAAWLKAGAKPGGQP
jgi:beta propeller repeat protein